ncbi:MAG: SDR family oxidoreductase [Microscillaceae bacterium]|nr:SDR family oxidoreductase [Microscillaceae bacterium]
MKKILITGANGLLGQKLLHLLNQQAVEVLATGRGTNRLQALQDLPYREMDITNPQQVMTVMADYQPNVVIHTAAMTQVDDCETQREMCWDMNVNAVKYLIEACTKQNCFLLHLSTDFIFDGQAGPYAETAIAQPLSYYGESKLTAEQLLLHSSIRWAIARTVLVYGITEAMSRSNIILWVKKSLSEGKTIQVVDDQWRTPTLAEDLAHGCWLIAQQEAEGIFNISGKDLLTPYEMAMQTAEYFGLDKSLIIKTDASKFSQAAVRPPRTGFIIDKARQILGYEPHTFQEGIAILEQQMKQL